MRRSRLFVFATDADCAVNHWSGRNRIDINWNLKPTERGHECLRHESFPVIGNDQCVGSEFTNRLQQAIDVTRCGLDPAIAVNSRAGHVVANPMTTLCRRWSGQEGSRQPRVFDQTPLRFVTDSRQQCGSPECARHAGDVAGSPQAVFRSLNAKDWPRAFLTKPRARTVQVDIDHDIASNDKSWWILFRKLVYHLIARVPIHDSQS